MLYWAAIFLIVSLVAAVFGFGGLAATSVGIAQFLFFIFIIGFIISIVLHLMKGIDKKTGI